MTEVIGVNNNTKNNEDNIKRNKDKKKNINNREEYGYGYDLSVADLKVLGQNDETKKTIEMMGNKMIMLSGIYRF